MHPKLQLCISFLVLVLVSCPPWVQAQAQDAQAEDNSSGRSYFDLGLKTGSFLPYGIEGVRELLPMWGVRLGHPVSETLAFEYDVDIAYAKGVQYFLGYLSLRHDFAVGRVLPLFFNIGFDAHYYKRADTYGEITGRRTEYPFKFSSGWHLGFGSETQIYHDFYFRADVRLGLSPSRQLTVSIGITYRI